MAGRSCSTGTGPLSALARQEFLVSASIFGRRVTCWSRHGARCSVDPSSPGRRSKWPDGLARSAIGVRHLSSVGQSQPVGRSPDGVRP
jgi:hypothetical protein